MATPAVLLDLDGTVADCRHRHHLIEGKDGRRPETWHAHSMACVDDPPVEGVIELVNILSDAGYCIVVCSGRTDVARVETENWLARHHVPWDYIELRPDGNITNNATFKVGVVNRLEAEEGLTFVLAIDDYSKTAVALAARGVPTVLVASFTGNKMRLPAPVEVVR